MGLMVVDDCAEHAHAFFKRFAIDGFVFEGRAIVVDGAWCVVEQCCYFRAFLYAQANEGKYPQFRGESVGLLDYDLLIFF